MVTFYVLFLLQIVVVELGTLDSFELLLSETLAQLGRRSHRRYIICHFMLRFIEQVLQSPMLEQARVICRYYALFFLLGNVEATLDYIASAR